MDVQSRLIPVGRYEIMYLRRIQHGLSEHAMQMLVLGNGVCFAFCQHNRMPHMTGATIYQYHKRHMVHVRMYNVGHRCISTDCPMVSDRTTIHPRTIEWYM